MENARRRQCPCGCGQELRAYNGATPLACYDLWRQIPREVRQRVMLPGVTEKDRRAACWQVLRHAHEVRKARKGGQ